MAYEETADATPEIEGIEALEPDARAPRRFGPRNWYGFLVTWYLRRHYARPRVAATPGTEERSAHAAVRRACITAAAAGAGAASIATTATVVTAETEGLAAIVTVPATALSLGAELLAHAIVHLRLTCTLGDLFDVRFDPDDPTDLWQLHALAFGTHDHDHDDGEDSGQALMERVAHANAHSVGEAVGAQLLGQTVGRTVVPFAGVAIASFGAWRGTKKFGDTVRRYMRYRRGLRDALAHAEDACAAHHALLVEGFWHVFVADGKLSPEEAAALSRQVRKLDAPSRAPVLARFVEDETGWIERLSVLPTELRPEYFHALEVAAAVDKVVTVPERKLLRRVAKELGITFDAGRLDAMVRDFESAGVLSARAKAPVV